MTSHWVPIHPEPPGPVRHWFATRLIPMECRACRIEYLSFFSTGGHVLCTCHAQSGHLYRWRERRAWKKKHESEVHPR